MEVSLKSIIEVITVSEVIGNKDAIVKNVLAIDDSAIDESSLFWCSDKNRERVLTVQKGVGIISKETAKIVSSQNIQSTEKLTWLVVDHPRRVFMQILKAFFTEKMLFGVVESTAYVHESVEFKKEKVKIGHNVVIEAGVKLGESVSIDHNTIIKSNTVIGDNVSIGAGCTIGGVGFGYEMNEHNEYEVIPHIGNVIIQSGVEIGNNVCIDRAVMGSTHIGENVKIDNLVHVAHGVRIGQNSLIIANAMIAGSVVIGENVWVAPSASILQKLTIGDNSMIGVGSVVTKSVDPSVVVAGVPAKKVNDR